MKALMDNMLHYSLGQAPLLMKGEMKTRDEGRRRKRREILVLGRLLSSCYAPFFFFPHFLPLATRALAATLGKRSGAIRRC